MRTLYPLRGNPSAASVEAGQLGLSYHGPSIVDLMPPTCSYFGAGPSSIQHGLSPSIGRTCPPKKYCTTVYPSRSAIHRRKSPSVIPLNVVIAVPLRAGDSDSRYHLYLAQRSLGFCAVLNCFNLSPNAVKRRQQVGRSRY